jgi:hypothetical protein
MRSNRKLSMFQSNMLLAASGQKMEASPSPKVANFLPYYMIVTYQTMVMFINTAPLGIYNQNIHT